MEVRLISNCALASVILLPLAELEFLSRFRLAVLFTFNHSVVTSKQSVLFQGTVNIFVQVIEGTSQCERNRTGLAGDSAAANRHFDVILSIEFSNVEGKTRNIHASLGIEVFFNRLAVNDEIPASFLI
jgi:hypothetical protein